MASASLILTKSAGDLPGRNEKLISSLLQRGQGVEVVKSLLVPTGFGRELLGVNFLQNEHSTAMYGGARVVHVAEVFVACQVPPCANNAASFNHCCNQDRYRLFASGRSFLPTTFTSCFSIVEIGGSLPTELETAATATAAAGVGGEGRTT